MKNKKNVGFIIVKYIFKFISFDCYEKLFWKLFLIEIFFLYFIVCVNDGIVFFLV